MTQVTEVSEGNKAIMFFDGAVNVEITIMGEKCPAIRYKGEYYPLDRPPLFNKDWNLLMPVVEKISKMPLLNWDNTPCTDIIDTCYPTTFNMPDEEGNVMFRFKGFSLHTAKTLIEAAWESVVEVADYHINQNKQS